jgi:hypothetical protein
MNGQNKHHSDSPSRAAQSDDLNTNGCHESKKRDLEESGCGDNPAKHARMQINNIEKRQEVMLQTAVGQGSSVLENSQDDLDKNVSNGMDSETDNVEFDGSDSIHSKGNITASGATSIHTETTSTSDNLLTTNENNVLKAPAKLSKPSFTLGDKAKDTFKEILKAAVSRVSSETAEKSKKISIITDSNSLRGTSSLDLCSAPTKSGKNSILTPTKLAMLDKGNLFENISLKFSSGTGDNKASSSLENLKEAKIKPSPETIDAKCHSATSDGVTSKIQCIEPNDADSTSNSCSAVEPAEPVADKIVVIEAESTETEAKVAVEPDSTEEKISSDLRIFENQEANVSETTEIEEKDEKDAAVHSTAEVIDSVLCSEDKVTTVEQGDLVKDVDHQLGNSAPKG